MEEAVGTGRDGLVAVDATGADDADGSGQLAVSVVHLLHHTSLNAGSMAAQQDVLGDVVGMLRDEERVLHVAGGVVGGEVHLREHVEVVLHLGTVGQHEAHAREDVDNLVRHDGQRVACT